MGRPKKTQVVENTTENTEPISELQKIDEKFEELTNTLSKDIDKLVEANENLKLVKTDDDYLKGNTNLVGDAVCCAKVYKSQPPVKFDRNPYGLLENINYVYTKEGNIDWRKLVSPKYLYLNKDRKDQLEKKYNKPFDQIDVVNDKVDDQFLVIQLGGLKELAQIRGYNSVDYTIGAFTDSYAAVQCSIDWNPNYETEGKRVVFSSCGSATQFNCSSDIAKNYMLETAQNRAFSRAIREFLKINIVSNQELGGKNTEVLVEKQENEVKITSAAPVNVLKALLASKNPPKTLDDLKRIFGKELPFLENVENLHDLDGPQVMDVIGCIKKKEAEKAKKV